MSNVNIVMNSEKNGIEIRFGGKPAAEIIESLKANGFRWSGKQKMWYAKQTEETIAFANSLNNGEPISSVVKNKTEQNEYDLWEMTRTSGIGNNYEKYHILDTKEIAAIIRKHIKPRFPMCKFSVKSDSNSIDIDLLASPFEKGSDELNAIVHYVYIFAQSYNYDNSDSMTDYFDVNFYGVYENSIVSYRYEQTTADENIKAMVDVFQKRKAEFEQAEAIREEQECQARVKQMEIDRQLAAERDKQIEADKKAIEEGAVIVDYEDAPYYILDLQSPHLNKFCTIDEALAEIKKNEFQIEPCQIVREIYLTEELYNKFKNMLMCSFSFLTGMGGTGTLDNRIMEMTDYHQMDEAERKTVEFYACECVAIYCDNKLMLVCNPEGYDYSRYVLIPAETYVRTNDYTIEQVVSDEELKASREVADCLYDASTDIIINNNLLREWNDSKFAEWRKAMTEYILKNKIDFNVNVVRAIAGDAVKFKIAMYRLLKEPVSIREQLDNAGLVEEQKITVLKFDDILGGVRAEQVYFRRYEYSDWGGRESVKLIVRVPRKSGEYYHILGNDCLIVNGWVEIPRELFWEVVPSKFGVCEKTKYLSFNRKQMDVTIDHLRSIGIKPIINTYKPQFN